MKRLTETLLGMHAESKIQTAVCEIHGEFESRCFIGNVWLRCPVCEAERAKAEGERYEARQRAEWLRATMPG